MNPAEKEMSSQMVIPLRKKRSYLSRHHNLWGWILITPLTLGLMLWVAFPLGLSFVISFTKWNMITPPEFTGFGNYATMFFHDPIFWQSVFVTIYYTLVGISLQIILAFVLAMLLNSEVKGMRVFRTIFFFPSLVPIVVTAALWMWLYNPQFGLLNSLLEVFNIPPQRWLSSHHTVIPSLIIMSLWTIGNIIIIFLAGLQNIPAELMDAVKIDGGNSFHRLVHVILPLMTPIIFYNIVIGVINGLQTFTQGYIMTNGGPANASLFYVLNLYRQAFINSKMGYACAMAWFLFFVTSVISLIIFKTSSRWVFYVNEEKK